MAASAVEGPSTFAHGDLHKVLGGGGKGLFFPSLFFSFSLLPQSLFQNVFSPSPLSVWRETTDLSVFSFFFLPETPLSPLSLPSRTRKMLVGVGSGGRRRRRGGSQSVRGVRGRKTRKEKGMEREREGGKGFFSFLLLLLLVAGSAADFTAIKGLLRQMLLEKRDKCFVFFLAWRKYFFLSYDGCGRKDRQYFYHKIQALSFFFHSVFSLSLFRLSAERGMRKMLKFDERK